MKWTGFDVSTWDATDVDGADKRPELKALYWAITIWQELSETITVQVFRSPSRKDSLKEALVSHL